MAIAETLDSFLTDFGVTVTNGTTTTTGILDMPTEMVGGGMVLMSDYMLTIKSSVYPSLAYGSSLTVNGIAYSVREVRAQDDGNFTLVFLSRV